MNKMRYSLPCLVTLWLMIFSVNGYGQRIWSNVSLNRSSVYLGQPVQVTIEVYTSTWFTTGIDPGNIQVEGAFTVYFRPVSTSIQDNGKTYAGVQLIYHVFPHRSGDITFPSLNLTVQSPPEGQFKGVERTLSTDEKPIRVKPIPADFSSDQWLVATGLSIADKHPENVTEVKTGDVWTRSITRTAYGTVAELIPPLAWDSIPGVSQYPSRSQVQSHKTKTAIYATRTETMRYLFTEEGDVTIPAKTIYWFHPSREKLYKKTLKEITLKVLPNPDLGMVKSIRDSLNIQSAREAVAAQSEDQPISIFGLTLPQFITVVIISMITIWMIIKSLWRTVLYFQNRRKQYLNSERYYFSRLKKAIQSKEVKAIENALYGWLDHLSINEPSATYLAEVTGLQELTAEVQKLHRSLTENEPSVSLTPAIWTKARKAYFDIDTQPPTTDWINP